MLSNPPRIIANLFAGCVEHSQRSRSRGIHGGAGCRIGKGLLGWGGGRGLSDASPSPLSGDCPMAGAATRRGMKMG